MLEGKQFASQLKRLSQDAQLTLMAKIKELAIDNRMAEAKDAAEACTLANDIMFTLGAREDEEWLDGDDSD